MRWLYYDDVSPEVISRMGYREMRMWAQLAEVKLRVKYPNIERWV